MVESINLAYFVIFILCLLVSAFFSSSETAFISLQKVRIRHMVESGVTGAEEVEKITKQPERLLATVLLGNNFVNTAAAALGTLIAVNVLGNSKGIFVSTVAVTFLIVVFCELTPKSIATRASERMALLYIGPIRAIAWILAPVTYVFIIMSQAISRLVGGTPMSGELIGEGEIRAMISMGREHGAMEEEEAEMMERVFSFGDRHVAEVMTPRPDIIWVEKDAKLNEFLAIYAESPHSRFPVFQESVDDVVGILWIKDVLLALAKGEISSDAVVTGLARPVQFVPETKIVRELFAEMQDRMTQIVMVADEYGGTAGLTSMEQLLEEIVGQLGDELAQGQRNVETIDINTFQVPGGMRIHQANEELELGLPEGDYETVAGFMLSSFGHIPKEGEQMKYLNTSFTVTEMKGVKIEKVLVLKE